MAKATKKDLSPFERFAFLLGGIGEETAATCPDFERRKLQAYALTILIPVTMGGLACAYMASTLTSNPYVIGGAGLLWSSFILLVDRAILSSYRATMPFIQKASQLLLRATIAAIMGATVSHPLVLLLFKDTVNVYVATENRAHLSGEQERLGREIQASNEALSQGEESLAGLSSRLAETVKPLSIPALPDASDSGAVKSQLGLLDAELSKQTEQRDRLSKEVAEWEARLQDEVGGKGISGKAGYGTESKRIEANELAWRRDQIKAIGSAIGILNERRVAILGMQNESDGKKKALLEKQLTAQTQAIEQMMSGRQALAQSMQSQIQATEANLASIRKQLDGLRESKARLDGATPPADIMAKTKALHSMFAAEGGQMALAVYLMFSALFIVLDLIPLTKFFGKAGPYDLALQQAELAWKARVSSGLVTTAPAQAEPRETEPEEPGRLDLDEHPLRVAEKLESMRSSAVNLGDLAERVGMSRASVSKYLRLLNTPAEFREELASIEDIGLEKSYLLATMENHEHRLRLLRLCRNRSFTVAELKEGIEQLRQFNEKVPLAN